MKIIRIDGCYHCPWHDFEHGWCAEDYDERTKREITDTSTIPDWCPLEDEEVKDA